MCVLSWLLRQKQYAEAQKIKRIADELERREREKIEEERLVQFQQREAKFRQQQQAELTALLKRIDGRRKEHLKQRELDSKRLLQRNRNVQVQLCMYALSCAVFYSCTFIRVGCAGSQAITRCIKETLRH